MDWAREIINELDGKKAIPANILALIRPSVALLDLGLPPDVLYEHFRWQIRDLLRRVHPDTRKGEVLTALQTLSDAFDMVKDKEIFAEVLTAARNDRSFERLGERALRGRIHGLQDEIANLKAQFRRQEVAHQEELVDVRRAAELSIEARAGKLLKQEAKVRVGEWVPGYLIGQAMRFSAHKERIKPIRECTQLLVASFAFSFATSIPGDADEYRVRTLYENARERAQKEPSKGDRLLQGDAKSLREIIESYNLSAIPASELFAGISKFSVPTIRWSFNHAAKKLGLSGMRNRNPGDVVQETRIDGWTVSLKRRYRIVLTHLARILGTARVTRADITVDRISIDHQFLDKDRASRVPLYLLGTVDLRAGFASMQTPFRKMGPRLQVRDDIIPKIEPFVCPGRAVISMSRPKSFTLKPEGSKKDWACLVSQKEAFTKTRTLFFLSHVVLDVE